jgi:hypothetical protein
MEDTAKYFSGVLSAMSCMIGLEVPFVNVMSKMDLVRKEGKRKKEVDRSVPLFHSAPLPFPSHGGLTRCPHCSGRFLDPDPELLRTSATAELNPKFHQLNSALVHLVRSAAQTV